MIYEGAVAALAFWAAILAGGALGLDFYGGFYLAGLAGLVAFLALCQRYPKTLVFLVVAMACFGIGRVTQAHLVYEGLPSHVIGAPVIIEGTVKEKKNSYDGPKGEMVRFVVAMGRFAYQDENRWHDGSGSIYLTVPAAAGLGEEDAISYRGTLKDITYYENEGAYDSLHRDMEMDIFAKAYSDTVKNVTIRHGPTGWRGWLAGLRSRLTDIFTSVLTIDEAHILSSLLFGGHYDELPPSLLESFSITGLIHILSVSGSHVALVLSLVQLVGCALGLRPRNMLAASALFVIGYCALSAFTPTVIRASVMGVIAATSVVAKRDYTALQALAIAVIAMLAVSPYLAYDLSFRLSCGASAGIILAARPLEWRLRFLPAFVRQGLSVCIGAQVLMVPFLFATFQAFPAWSFLANLTVGPLLDLVILLGLVAAIVGCLWLPASMGILWVLRPILLGAIKANYFIAALPFSRIWHGAWPLAAVIIWYLVFAAIFFKPWRRVCAGAVCVIALTASAWAVTHRDDCVVRVFDVGKDQAVCAVYGDDTTQLWYEKSQWSHPEMVSYVLAPALRYQGIFHLDTCQVSGHEAAKQEAALAALFPVDTWEKEAVDWLDFPDGLQVYFALPKKGFPAATTAAVIHEGADGEAFHQAREMAELYDVPCFAPSRDGQVTARCRDGTWRITCLRH